jgi:hypothetical protein
MSDEATGEVAIRHSFYASARMPGASLLGYRVGAVEFGSACGQVDAPLEGDAVEQQEAEGTAEAPNQGAPAADGDDHQASEAANPHEGGDAEAHHEGGLEQGAATEVPGASPDGAGVHGAGMDGEGESEHAQQHDAPADEMGDPEDVAPAAIPAGELMPPAASEVASPPIPTGPMPADDAAMNEGLTSDNSAFVDFLVASENFSHRKQIHLDAIFEDIKKALEIELGISATAQQLSLDDRTHRSAHTCAYNSCCTLYPYCTRRPASL